MAERGALEAAAAAGVIRAEQVGPLHDFLASRAAGVSAAPSGEEDLRFIRNFHDLFLAIGILLLAVGLAIAVSVYVATSGVENPQIGATTSGALFGGCGAIMWGLGEVFARRRRLFLPAIAIVISLTGFIVVAVALLYAGVLLGRGIDNVDMSAMPPELRVGILIASAFAFITPLAFYARFRLPFSLGLTGAGMAGFIVVLALTTNFDLTVQYLAPLQLGLGVLLFLAGVAFDARDPARTTRYSDNGFWLHFAAAPLILRGAFGLIDVEGSGNDASHAALTLGVVLLLGVVSLLINRRALIVSTLITTGVAIGILMNAVGLGEGALAASTLIVLGAFVLILGASWHVFRRALLGWVKPDGVWARIFPPETQAAA